MNKRGFHRAFAVLLAVFLMLTGISLNATAETAVAQVGEQTYSSLADAVSAVNEDKGAEPLSLTLLTDVVVETAKFTVSRGNVMIDGGGHTLTVTGNAKNDIVLTVTGANANVRNLNIKTNFGGICQAGTGTSVIENVSIIAPDSMANSRALFLIAGNASGELNVTIRNCKGRSGKAPTCQFGVNAAGGTVANKVNAVLENNHFVNPADYGRCIDVRGAGCNITAESGYYQTNSTAVFRVWAGELTVNGGIYYLAGNGDVLLAAEKYDAATGGKITVNDGVFVSKSGTSDKVGCVYSANGTAIVNGGTFAMIGSASSYLAAKCGATEIPFPEGANVLAYNKPSTPTMSIGAAARITTANGLLFTSTVSKAVADNAAALLEAMKAFETEESPATLTYGTLICPEESLTGPGGSQVEFSVRGLAGAVDAVYWNIPATAAGIDTDADGNMTYRVAITNIPENMESTRFCAVSYIMLSAGTVTFYFYSTYSAVDNSRSIADVSAKALADTSQSFTADEKEILQATAAN